MRFQIKYSIAVFYLILSVMIFFSNNQSAQAQLPDCTCGNSTDSTCADGFRVTFLGQLGTTFTYDVCNEGPNSDCSPPMALSHADIIITNPGCIANPGDNIITTIIGTDGVSTRACDAPTDKDPSCGFRDLSELLIKCDDTDGVFEPGPGQCVQIEIDILNTPGIGVGPSISLNKAGPECGLGCLLGPSCETCGPPPMNPCEVTVEKQLVGSLGPASFGYSTVFTGPNAPENFNQVLSPPNTPTFGFSLPQLNSATVTENDLPTGWSFNNVSCNTSGAGISCETDNQTGEFTCSCLDGNIDSSATCTFFNDAPTPDMSCDIEIVKQTNMMGNETVFDFTSSQGNPNFNLQDGQSHEINSVDPGVLVVIEETLPENWILDNIVCTGGNENQFDIDIDGDQLVRITCDDSAPGVTRTCTYQNRFSPPPPGSGCCVVAEGLCNITTTEECSIPPNINFIEDSNCINVAECEMPPPPGEGCCVEAEGVCSITTSENCPIPPNEDYLGNGSTCTAEPRCFIPPPPPSIPTIAEWGLITMAGVFGIIGFIGLRRARKTTESI